MMFYETSSNNYHSCIFCIYWDIVHFPNIWNKTIVERLFNLWFQVHISFHIAYIARHLSLQQKLTSLYHSNIVCVSRKYPCPPKGWVCITSCCLAKCSSPQTLVTGSKRVAEIKPATWRVIGNRKVDFRGSQKPTFSKKRMEQGGGEGFRPEDPPLEGYGYFLEQHILIACSLAGVSTTLSAGEQLVFTGRQNYLNWASL